MTSTAEPLLYALSVEPRSARAGETVRIEFRTRNHGTQDSPSGTVTFALGAGLEALDATEAGVEPVAPGEFVVAAIRARVAVPVEDGSRVAVRAALHLPGTVLETNVCAVTVHGRAILDGPASGTFVERIDAATVRVRAVVTNEGDGPARGVQVVVPAPIGCAHADGAGAALLERERLDPGERADLAFEARIVAPVAEIRADAAVVRFGGGRRVALAARDAIALEPDVAVPDVVLTPSRRRVDLAVDVRNEGWVDARDVRVRITLPSGLRLAGGSIVVDGVAVDERPRARRASTRAAASSQVAHVERDAGAHAIAIVIGAAPARSTVRVALSVAVPAGFPAGVVVVELGAHRIEAPFEPSHVRELRLRVIGEPRTGAPGEMLRVAAQVVNAGDVPEIVTIGIGEPVAGGSEAASRTLSPGAVALVELGVCVPEDAMDECTFAPAVVVRDTGGERARAVLAVMVRDRAWLAADVPEAALPPVEIDIPAMVHAAVYAPDRVVGGAPFSVKLDIDVEDAVDRLAVAVPVTPGCTYVPGSTLLDGRAVLDRIERPSPDATAPAASRSPLEGDGLSLRGVPAGSRITVAWSLIADATRGDAFDVTAEIAMNGERRSITPVTVTACERDAFAARPAGLPYHVDACTIGPAAAASPLPDPPSVSLDADDADDARHEPAIAHELFPSDAAGASEIPRANELPRANKIAFEMRLDAARVDEISRLLHGMRGGGLVAHLFAVRFFFPDAAGTADAGVSGALDAVRGAVRDLFNRLFVKLRIPGFGVTADDLDDPALRTALVTLFERLLDAAPDRIAFEESPGAFDRDRVREMLSAFATAPYGAPAVLRALVALLPQACDDDPALAAHVRRHANLLDAALSRYEDLPLELFDEALAHRADAALDDARADVVAALRARAELAEIAC